MPSREEVLFQRLEELNLGLTDGLQEDDLLGPDAREPFRAMAIHLAQHIHDIVVAVGVDNPQAVQTSLLRVKAAASADATARSGGLDRALAALLQTLSGAAHPAGGDNHIVASRVGMLEHLVGFVQAMQLLPAPMDTTDAHVDHANKDPMHSTSDAIRHVARLADVDAGCADASHVLAAVRAWLTGCIQELPEDFFQPVVDGQHFTEQQKQMLEQVNSMLQEDYTQRRAALLARTRLALQAMEASPRVSEEDSGAKLAAIAAQADAWTAQPGVSLEHLLSLTHGQCMSLDPSQRRKQQGPSSFVRHVRIAEVPDRGGRGDARKGGATTSAAANKAPKT